MYEKKIILSPLLYGCKIWSLVLREEHKLQVSENKGLRKIFGPKKDETNEQFRILHNKALIYRWSLGEWKWDCYAGREKECM
jgi:hypothetical protein